jgi:hypothetical protein
MEKNYMLRLNDNYLYFKKLESVKDFFIKCGVKDNLIDEDEEVYSLDKLEDIFELQLNITNDCMCERGDDYCDLYLGIITFED